MKHPNTYAIAGFILILGIISIAFRKVIFRETSDKHHIENVEKGFAVVELFTSEGCSSCPPADKLVAKIEKEDAGKRVYILSYHVDYWNRLGWKDRFSEAAFSNRQKQYASWLNLNSIYTPQIVVNGKTEFVGSNESALEGAIREALKDSSVKNLRISCKVENDHVNIEYATDDLRKGSDLVLALIQKSGQSNVKAGENEGLTLTHVQIVRKLIYYGSY